jgi:hypothetical protein
MTELVPAPTMRAVAGEYLMVTKPLACFTTGVPGSETTSVSLSSVNIKTSRSATRPILLASDNQIPLFVRHLSVLGYQDRLAILLYTRGGDTNVPWAIVSFLREHCNHLTVLVPFVAHSSGTLLALGADDIIMSRFGTLSPIDPTVANAFNPQDPTNPALRLPIAVEDVLAYLELGDERAGGADLKDPPGSDARVASFEQLVQSVHPLALGNAKRSINQIRQLSKKLIGLHDPDRTQEELNSLVTRLTTEFYSHQHLISRREATEMGLPIVDPDLTLEALLLDYYDVLKVDLELLDAFDPPRLLRSALAGPSLGQPVVVPPLSPETAVPSQDQPQPALAAPLVPVVLERAYLETVGTCDAYVTRGTIAVQGIQGPPFVGPGGQILGQGPTQQAVAFEVYSERWEQLA